MCTIERNCKSQIWLFVYKYYRDHDSISYLICLWQPIDEPYEEIFEENGQFRRAPPLVRVEKMFERIQKELPGAPSFLLCLLPERKNSDLYG